MRSRLAIPDFQGIASRCLLAAVLAAGADNARCQTPAGAGKLVGVYADLRRTDFIGLKTFDARDLNDGLLKDASFLAATHPLASWNDYLRTLEAKVLTGYQASGFPDVQVAVAFDETEERIKVRVEEGPRFRSGTMRVTGAESVPADWMVSKLMKQEGAPYPSPGEHAYQPAKGQEPTVAGVSANVSVHFSGTEPYFNSAGELVKPAPPLWNPGEPAYFDAITLKKVKDAALVLLKDAGFPRAQCDVHVRPNRDAGTADLEIEVTSVGSRAIVGDIRFVGLKVNNEVDLRNYLQCESGQPWGLDLIGQIERKLWGCGRFRRYRVVPQPSLSNPGAVDLTLELREAEELPPFAAALTKEQEGWLRFRQWLTQALYGREDLVFQARFPMPGSKREVMASLCLSAQGFLASVSDPRAKAGEEHLFALILSTNEFGLYCPGERAKFEATRPGIILQLWMHLVPNQEVQSENSNQLNMGAGFRNAHLDEPARTLDFELLAAPATFLISSTKLGPPRWTDNRLAYEHEGAQIEFEADTGRLVEFRLVDEEDQVDGHVQFKVGAYTQLAREIQNQSSLATNYFVQGRVLSSLIGFAGDRDLSAFWPLLWQSGLPGTTNQLRAATRLLVHGVLEPLLVPLDEFLTKMTEGEDEDQFTVPAAWPAASANMIQVLVKLGSAQLFAYCRAVFPPQSWPVALTRNLALMIEGGPPLAEEEIRHWAASPDIGPVGLLASAWVIRYLDPSLSETFARSARERLSAAHFRLDYELIATNQTPLNQSFAVMRRTLAETPEATINDIDAFWSNANDHTLHSLWSEVRNLGNGDDAAVSPGSWERLWNLALQPLVVRSLDRLEREVQSSSRANDAFQQGWDLFAKEGSTENDAEAVRLFHIAAAAGHGEAQYLLGVAAEEGRGMPKDFGQALNWYRTAGSNACPQAQAALGTILSDGVSVSPDSVEACFWLSLASAQGHQPSRLTLRILSRKLSKQQQEDLQSRLDTFQASRSAQSGTAPK